ncbi:MAG TPA: hypothetical protein VGN80_19105 [Devosiaceae bacterium]|jgi:hypothetical protein|nr:hypothetical protein [Devosiaceae bacterium]
MTKREPILDALATVLQVPRNEPLGDVVGTFATLLDGAAEETDEFFNVPIFEFTARPVLLIVVQAETGPERDAAIEAAVELYAAAIEAAAPLDANVTDVRVLPPEMARQELWGALPMKGAEVTIEIDYWADRATG